MLPSIVMPPVIVPRTTAEPRPVSSPVSEPRLRPAHADAGPERDPEAHHQGGVRVRGDGGGEDRRQRGDRAVDQADEPGLHDAQQEVAFVAEAGAVDPARQRPLLARRNRLRLLCPWRAA